MKIYIQKLFVSRDQNGFSHVEVVLALVFIALIGFVGDRVFVSSHAQSPQSSSNSSNCTVSPILVNSCHPLISSHVAEYPGVTGGETTSYNQVVAGEARVGKNFKFDVIHTDYHQGEGGDTLTPEEIQFASQTNQTVFLNWWPTKNWAQGATSSIYPEVDAMAASIKKNVPDNTKVMIALQHEMNDKVGGYDPGTNDDGCTDNDLPGKTKYGLPATNTPANYRAMVINVENRMSHDGVSNVVWALLYESFNENQTSKFPDCLDAALYPGNQYVDWTGYDTYGHGEAYTGTKGSGPFQDTAGKTYEYLESLSNQQGTNKYGTVTAGMMNKPVVLGEMGACGDQTDQQRVDYYKDAKFALDQNLYPQIQLYMNFDAPGTGNSPPGGCQIGYEKNGTPVPGNVVQNAFNAFATDPIFQGDTTTTPPPPPKQPVINSFTASPTSVTVGNTSTLSWSTTNVSTCSLNPGGPQTSTATSWTSPKYTTAGTNTYTLSCTGNGTTVSKTASVTVTTATPPPPPPMPLTVSITDPTSGETVSKVVVIKLSITDASPIVSSKLVWGGTNVIRNATSQNSYGWGSRWNSTAAGNGSRTISATVKDASGSSVTKTVTVNVSNSTCGGVHLFGICWF